MILICILQIQSLLSIQKKNIHQGKTLTILKNLSGKTFVFEANPNEFKLIAANQLGDEVYASPIVSGDRLYLRVAFKGDERKEFLYAIGKK